MKLRGGVHAVGPDEADRVLDVWEASVRATHRFLSDADIRFLKPMVLPAVRGMEFVFGVRDEEGALAGFAGTADGKIEALFVHPTYHHLGVGRRLVRHAVNATGAAAVDVNEQNGGAVAFYLRLGFRVEGRSEVDGMGLPFPLLHLELDDRSKL